MNHKLIRTIIFTIAILSLPSIPACSSKNTSGNTTNTESVDNTYTNPLFPDRGPDPWTIYHDGYYYYTHTMGNRIDLWRTTDITDVKNGEHKTVWIPTDPKNKYELWAPEIHNIDGKWYIYYCADDGDNANHQIYVLENTEPNPLDGEFTFKGHISTDPDNNWAIDATVFSHHGQLYMLWSGWQTPRVSDETQCIFIARMANPWTLQSERQLISKPTYEWEKQYTSPDGATSPHVLHVNEGPQALFDPEGQYIHIAYSASAFWTPYYCLGLLTARADSDLLDPRSWTKSDNPVFAQSAENEVYGCGHNSFFISPDGKEHYILYHARDTQVIPAGKGDTRTPRMQRFEWKDGYPVFGTPKHISTRMTKPSGTPL